MAIYYKGLERERGMQLEFSLCVYTHSAAHILFYNQRAINLLSHALSLADTIRTFSIMPFFFNVSLMNMKQEREKWLMRFSRETLNYSFF